MKKLLVLLLFGLIITIYPAKSMLASETQEYTDYKFKTEEKNSYSNYLNDNSGKSSGEDTVTIDAKEYSSASDDVVLNKDVVNTTDKSSLKYEFEIKSSGMYNIQFNYCTIQSKGLDIVRSIKIDGKSPFDEATTVTFKRMWSNKEDIKTVDGNDISPEQIEVLGCSQTRLEDTDRITGEPLQFYLSSGEHSLEIDSVQEPLALEQIVIEPVLQVKSYEQVAADYKQNGYMDSSGQNMLVEGETANLKSTNELAPGMNYSSSNITPSDPYKQKVNIIGGEEWSNPGDYIEWNIDVPETGLYNITINAQQNFERDLYSTRRLTINGQLPFAEANNIKFLYNKDFQGYTLSDEEGNPYLFYFESGINKLRLENITGDLGSVIYQLNLASEMLNEMYREVLMITGTTPDKYRSYMLEDNIENLDYNLQALYDNLQIAQNQIVEIVGGKGDITSTIDKLVLQLERFIDDPDLIAKELSSFKSNISALPATMQSITNQKLTIDSIELSSPDTEPTDVSKQFIPSFIFGFNRFIASFTNDLDSTSGSNDSEGETIEVWVTRGQDEMQSWRRVIDDYFTPQTGINVDLKLVGAATLLPAVLSGEGPDVAMFLNQDVPVNYATRNAVEDLSTYPEYDEVSDRFYQSAITPFEYEGGVYGLPEEQKFPVMFYRTDIFKELGLEVPTTWDEMFEILPILNANNMELMLEPTIISALGQVNPNLIYTTLLYQDGGSYYKNGDMESALTDEQAIDAFRTYCKFYTNYSVDVTADFSNRFKTGEAPIGIMDYTQYNQVAIFAPELAGNIGIAPVPGTVNADGSINDEVASLTNGMVMFKSSEHKGASWEFMKWATSSDAQERFAEQLEARVGKGGRWQSANVEALSNSSYPSSDLKMILEQQSKTVGVPQVPGGYISAREEENAFKEVVNEQANPTESMFEHVININKELTIKRKEFDLDYIDPEVSQDETKN